MPIKAVAFPFALTRTLQPEAFKPDFVGIADPE